MASINPYDAYKQMYESRTNAINAQTQQAEAERQQREQAAQKTLEASNRGTYTTYKNAINPYGRFASQNNFSQGVSDYYKNASYGTMLQGLGTNQYNYNDAMNNSNSLWQNYLAQKAGNEADALSDYNNALVAQQKYDKEQEDAEKERQEAIRQYNLNLQLQRDQLARQQAQDAEDKRRYEQEWAYKLQQDKLAAASSGGSSGGSSYRSASPSPEAYEPAEQPATPQASSSKSGTGSQKYKDTSSNTVVRTGYLPSSVKGMRYSVGYNSKGEIVKRTLVKDPNSKVKGRVYTPKY